MLYINMCIAVVIRKLSWKKILGYWIAQYLAAFLSSAIVFGVYYGKLCYVLTALVCVFIILVNTCTLYICIELRCMSCSQHTYLVVAANSINKIVHLNISAASSYIEIFCVIKSTFVGVLMLNTRNP